MKETPGRGGDGEAGGGDPRSLFSSRISTPSPSQEEPDPGNEPLSKENSEIYLAGEQTAPRNRPRPEGGDQDYAYDGSEEEGNEDESGSILSHPSKSMGRRGAKGNPQESGKRGAFARFFFGRKESAKERLMEERDQQNSNASHGEKNLGSIFLPNDRAASIDEGFDGEGHPVESMQIVEAEDEDYSEGEVHHGIASVSSSVVNLANTIIGGGILALPYSVKTTGLVFGIFILGVVFVLSNASFHLLLECARITTKGPRLTFRWMAKLAHGRLGVLVSDFSVIVGCFGILCSYMIAICDMLAPLLAFMLSLDLSEVLSRYRPAILTLVLVLVLPLASMRRLDSLKFTSFLALVSAGYVCILIVTRGTQSIITGSVGECAQRAGCLELWKIDSEIFSGLPIIILAFTSQMNYFTIYSELKSPNPRKMHKVGWGSTSLCTVVYLLSSVFGYLTFFEETKGNILLNYPVNDIMASIGRIAFTSVLTFSFPVMSHPCIQTSDELLLAPRFGPLTWKRWVSEAVIVCLLAYFVALAVSDISLVFSFIGATTATLISFILPATCYLALCPDRRIVTRWKLICYFFLIIGFGLMIMRTYKLIAEDILHH